VPFSETEMETIELRVTDAASEDYGHLFIIYTNREGREFVIRGGPGPLFVVGKIDVEIGPYTKRSRDWVPPAERSGEDNVVLERGQNLEEKYLKMAFFAQLVEQSEVDYDTLAAMVDVNSDRIVNSNSLVSAALASVGIDIQKEDLPPSERRRPAAGFENKKVFEAPISKFLSQHHDDAATQHAAGFAAVYRRLEDRFVQKHRGQIRQLGNATNRLRENLEDAFQDQGDAREPPGNEGRFWDGVFDDTVFPEHIAEEFQDVDWRATEENIRRVHRRDPALASSILGELAAAKSLGMPWKKDFARNYGSYFIYRDGSAASGNQGHMPAGLAPVAAEGASVSPDWLPQDAGRAATLLDLETERLDGNTVLPGEAARPLSGPARQTSFDRFLRLGLNADQEAEALEEYAQLWQRSFLDMGGDVDAAEALAIARFSETWGRSDFAHEASGIVLKYPAEKVYPAKDGTNRDYIREDVHQLLETLGVKASRWSLMPNAATGRDWRQGGIDENGYGPRMTLTYDDEAGAPVTVTDSFQAQIQKALARGANPAKAQPGGPVKMSDPDA